MDKCPVCNNKLKCTDYYDSDFHITVEEHERCYRCGYDYEFAYGAYKIMLNNKEFLWSYDTPYIERNQMYRKIKKEAWSVQKRLRRSRKLKGKIKIRL